jgi:MFS family permease
MAGVMTGATTLLADYFRGPARDRVMGEQGAFMGLGGVVFLLAAGELAEVSWRLPFLMYGLGLPVVVAGWFCVREPEVEPEPIEVAAGDEHRPAGKVRLPWGLILGIYAAGLVGHLAFYFVPVKLDFLIHQQFQGTPRLSGIAIAVITMSSALTALGYGSLQRRASHLTILAATFGLLGAGYVGMGLASSYVVLLLGLTVAGAGLGILIPNLNIWLVGRTPADKRGRLLGGVSMAVFLGQFLSPFISTPLQDGMGIASGFVAAGWVLVAIGVVAGLKSLWDAQLRSRQSRQAA